MATRQDVLDWLAEIEAGLIHLHDDNMGLASAAIALIDVGTEEGELPPGYLTENFTLAEMIYSDTAKAMGQENYPNDQQAENLQRVCDVLERIRSLCGDNPVVVSSGYRCPEVNAAVGGVPDSAHVEGLAADITIPDFGTTTQICEAVRPYLGEWQIDQLIDESGGGARWVHVGLCDPPEASRCECFKIG
jgi:hypothetical protein